MPVVRYQIRNEYGLSDPELYGAAERNDPEALLEGVAMAGLVGVLRQLGDLAEFAAEIFHDLHEEVMATSARGHTLMLRVQQLELEFPATEKAVLSQTSHSNLAPSSGMDWHPNIQMDQNIVTQGDMPRFILNSYEECRGPPQLVTLDKFDIAGAGACLKRYSDPSFFKTDFASSGKMEPEFQRGKKARKTKKKALRLRNGETLESLMKPDEDSKLLVSEKVFNNFSLKRVKLKTRPVNSMNTSIGRSYMESILYSQPTDNNVLHEDSFDQSYLKGKLIEPAPVVHEIMIDTSSNNSVARKGGQVQPAVKQKVMEVDSDRLRKKEVENSTKETLWIPTNRVDELSSIIGSDNNVELPGVGGRKGISNSSGELRMKDSAEGGSKTDGSADIYVSDGVASELDNYVDALTTMDSEMDTDTEGRAKPVQNMKSQGMDSDTDEEHETKVHLDSHSFEYSNGMLNCSSLCKEKSGLITGDPAGTSADIQLPEKNEAPSWAIDNSGTHSSIALPRDLGNNASKDQDVASVALHENTMAMGLDIPESMNENGVSNVKELNKSDATSEFGLATYGSCIAGSTSPAHGGLYLNSATDAEICMSNCDSDPQQFIEEEQATNVYLKAIPSEHVKELNESSATSEFGLATYGSCLAGSTSPAHDGPYLNSATDAEICMSNGDSDPQQSIKEEQTTNAYLKAIPSEHVGSTANIENLNVDLLCTEDAVEFPSSLDEAVPPAGIEDVLTDISPVQSYNMEGLNPNVTCDFINEREISVDSSMDDAHEDAQTKLPSAPYSLVPEVVTLEDVSTENFQELSSSSVEDHLYGLVKQRPKNDDGEVKVITLDGDSECSRTEMLLESTSDVPESEPQISSTQKPELEHFSDSESEMFHDAKLQASSSDNLHPCLLEGSSDMLDDTGRDGSVPVGAHLSDTHIDAFSTERNTGSGLTTESGDIKYDSRRGNSALTSSHVPSVSDFKLQEEFVLHDSAPDQHDLKSDVISGPENKHGLDSRQTSASNKEDNIMILAHSRDEYTIENYIVDSANSSSLTLNHAPREDLLKNGEVSLSHADVNVVSVYPSDAGQASDVKHPLFSSLQEDISSVSVADENNTETSESQALIPGGIRGLNAEQRHDVDDQQLEDAKNAHSSDPWPVPGDGIPAQTEVKAAVVETDTIPEQHILCSPDPYSSKSPNCINCDDNNQLKQDKDGNPGKENVVRLYSVESNQGLDSMSFLHESLEDSTSPSSVLSMTTMSMVQPLDCSHSASVETAHSLDYADASNNRVDLLDKPLVAETQFNPVTINTSPKSEPYVSLSNGFNCKHSDAEAHFPSQPISKFPPRSMDNFSELYIEAQNASSGLFVTEASVLHESSHIEYDWRLDNASVCNQLEEDPHVLHESSSDPFERSIQNMIDSNISPCNASISNHTEAEAHVPTQSSSEIPLGAIDNKSDTPVPTLRSFDFSIPELGPSKLSDPGGYDQAFSIPFRGHNLLERPVNEAPPLPPLPPLQWRLGKLRVSSGISAGATTGPSSWTPELVSDHPHGYPNPLGEKAHCKNPFTDDLPSSEDMRFGYDLLNWEDTRVNCSASKPPEERNNCGTTSLGGGIANPSQSSGTCVEGQEYHSGQEVSKEAKQQPANPFVPVAVLCNESNQHVSSNFGEPAQPLNSVLIPVSEHNGPQSNDSTLWRNLAQPSSQYLLGSTIENDNHHYGHRVLGDERIQPINISMPSSTMQGMMHQNNSFMPGGEDVYGPYSLFPVMDSGKPNGKSRSIRNRPRDLLIEAVASHDKSTLRKVSEMAQTSTKPKVDERNTLLEQIRNKSFNLKPAVATKRNVNAPSTNLKVAAILEKANAIRQAFVGSDEDDDDNWSDC